MRPLLSYLSLIAATATFAPIVVAAPVILNPGFEDQAGVNTYDAANWKGEYVGKVSRQSYQAQSGLWSMRFVDRDVETINAITGFTVGSVYSLTFWLKGGDTNSGTYFEVDQISGSPNKWTWTKQTLTNWTQYDFRFMATATTSDMRFKAKSSLPIYLDTLELLDCTGTGSVYSTYSCGIVAPSSNPPPSAPVSEPIVAPSSNPPPSAPVSEPIVAPSSNPPPSAPVSEPIVEPSAYSPPSAPVSEPIVEPSSFSLQSAPVSVPLTLSLIGLGLVAMGAHTRRRRF